MTHPNVNADISITVLVMVCIEVDPCVESLGLHNSLKNEVQFTSWSMLEATNERGKIVAHFFTT